MEVSYIVTVALAPMLLTVKTSLPSDNLSAEIGIVISASPNTFTFTVLIKASPDEFMFKFGDCEPSEMSARLIPESEYDTKAPSERPVVVNKKLAELPSVIDPESRDRML